MFVPKKMKLNKYVKVKCPSSRDLFSRIGPRTSTAIGSNDGTDFSNPVDFNSSILDNFAKISRDERSRLYDEYVKSQQQETETKSVEQEKE